MAKKLKSCSYSDAGVNIDSGNKLVKMIWPDLKKTYGPEVLDNEGGFGGLYSLATSGLFSKDYKKPVLVGATDGVGTKLKLAFMMDKHDTVGIDLVAMSVNDLIVQGARPLFFLDYFASGKLEVNTAADVIKGIAEGCYQSGCALIGGETAEMPGFYPPGEYDLAGFAVGLVDYPKLITGKKIKPGNIIIGLASSGLHSNGYSLARKVFFDVAKYKVNKYIDEFGCTLGEELLKPTQIYAKALNSIQENYSKRQVLLGIAHITGGGLLENIPRVLPDGCAVKLNRKSWDVPPVFKMMKKLGNIQQKEMDRVFNQGIGMILVVSKQTANSIVKHVREFGLDANVIGEVVKGNKTVKLG